MMLAFQIRVASCALGTSDLSLPKAINFIWKKKRERKNGCVNTVMFLTFRIVLPLHPQTWLAGCVFWSLNPSGRECLRPWHPSVDS